MQSVKWSVASGVILAGLGLAVGIYVGRAQGAAAGGEPAHVDHPPEFSAQTLANLGVAVGDATLSTFTRTVDVQAVVQDAPLNTRPVTAPLPGVVSSIAVEPGAMVTPQGPLVAMLRDAIPRPRLEFTGDIFKPVSETLHEAFSELRTAVQALQVVDTELARMRALDAGTPKGEAPLIGGKARIDLEYERRRAVQRVENARSELEHHGLSHADIEKVESGAHPPRGRELWRRVLTVHGLWTPAVERLHAALPEATRDLPWTIATLGELAGTGLVSDGLVAAVTRREALQRHFLECAGLLLQGETVARVDWLAAQGALDSGWTVRAPDDHAWDVAAVEVRPGQSVARGQTLLVLHDPRRMWLRLEPVGGEIEVVLAAVRDGAAVEAKPLLRGAGPALEGLRILRLTGGGAAGAPGETAYIRVDNERLGGEAAGDAAAPRTWRLRAGLRYEVRIPVETRSEVFVLSRDAVAVEGVDRVVYIQNGPTFRHKPVRVLYEDDERVVVPNDGALMKGDRIVTAGAFALSVAMQQSAGGGHGHSHDH